MLLTPGQQHDSTMAHELLPAARGKAVVGDSGYDANVFIDAIRDHGMKPVTHANPSRKWHLLELDRKRYRRRYLIECFFHRLKRFRAVACREDHESLLALYGIAV